jgi:hypothetical protein
MRSRRRKRSVVTYEPQGSTLRSSTVGLKNGNANCAPVLALLKAEEVSLMGDFLLKIESAYDDAIGIEDRDGFRQPV